MYQQKIKTIALFLKNTYTSLPKKKQKIYDLQIYLKNMLSQKMRSPESYIIAHKRIKKNPQWSRKHKNLKTLKQNRYSHYLGWGMNPYGWVKKNVITQLLEQGQPILQVTQVFWERKAKFKHCSADMGLGRLQRKVFQRPLTSLSRVSKLKVVSTRKMLAHRLRSKLKMP